MYWNLFYYFWNLGGKFKAIQMHSICQTRINVSCFILSLKWQFKHICSLFLQRNYAMNIFFSKAVVIKHDKQNSYVPKSRHLYASFMWKILTLQLELDIKEQNSSFNHLTIGTGHSPDFFFLLPLLQRLFQQLVNRDWPARNQQWWTCHSLQTECFTVCTAWRKHRQQRERESAQSETGACLMWFWVSISLYRSL